MSYDVSVRFKTSQERENMKVFLEKNKELLEQLSNIPTVSMPYHSREVFYGENLGYTPKFKNMLGFHGTGIPEYIWNLCAWMTVKSSYRDKNNKLYFYYDKDRMIVTFDTQNTTNTVVDAEGIPIIIKQEVPLSTKIAHNLLGVDPEKAGQDMQDLLIKLNTNWYEFNHNVMIT